MTVAGRRPSDIALAAALLLLIGLSTYYFFEQNARSDRIERRADHLETRLGTSQKNLELSTAQTRQMIAQAVRKGITPAVSPTEVPVPGQQGQQGQQGVQGLQGIPGIPGRGIASIKLDGCYLMVTYTTGATARLGPACGPPGAVGPTGPPGVATDGKDGKDGSNGTDGKNGSNGQDGRGITSITVRCDADADTPQPNDGTVTFVFNLTDGTVQDVPSTTECSVS